MKRIKLILIGSSIILSLGTAWATTRPTCAPCENFQQYHLYGGQYIPTGDFGFDYFCLDEYPDICTYYRPNPIFQPNTYLPCQRGLYIDNFISK